MMLLFTRAASFWYIWSTFSRIKSLRNEEPKSNKRKRDIESMNYVIYRVGAARICRGRKVRLEKLSLYRGFERNSRFAKPSHLRLNRKIARCVFLKTKKLDSGHSNGIESSQSTHSPTLCSTVNIIFYAELNQILHFFARKWPLIFFPRDFVATATMVLKKRAHHFSRKPICIVPIENVWTKM